MTGAVCQISSLSFAVDRDRTRQRNGHGVNRQADNTTFIRRTYKRGGEQKQGRQPRDVRKVFITRGIDGIQLGKVGNAAAEAAYSQTRNASKTGVFIVRYRAVKRAFCSSVAAGSTSSRQARPGSAPSVTSSVVKLVAARNQHRHLVAGLVLLEPRRQAIRAHAHVVDREDLVVHVQAGIEGGRAAAHGCDDQPAGVVARAGADRRRAALRVSTGGSAGRSSRAPRRSRVPRWCSAAFGEPAVRSVPAASLITA